MLLLLLLHQWNGGRGDEVGCRSVLLLLLLPLLPLLLLLLLLLLPLLVTPAKAAAPLL